MKKNILFLLLLVSSSLIWAQKPSLNKAYNAYSNQDYVEAKQLIDECVTDPKLATKANTFLYKGNIYRSIAINEYENKGKDYNYQIKYPEAPVQAFDAFKKAKELDKNVEGYNMLSPDQALPSIYILLYYYSDTLLKDEKFKEAILVLDRAIESYEMGKPFFPMKGELYYYYAYALEMDQNPNAKIYYEKAILDSSQNINVYVRLIEQYKNESQQDLVLSTIKKAKVIFPNDPSINISEVDYYFQIQDTITARNLLNNLPVSIYKNADHLFNASNCYIKDGNYLKANELLKTANSLNPNNYNILFNLGVCNYYISSDKFKQFNELEVIGDKTNSAKMKVEYDYYLNEARVYFEKVVETTPNDLNILNTLMSIYGRLQSPKFDEISKKIETLKKQQ